MVYPEEVLLIYVLPIVVTVIIIIIVVALCICCCKGRRQLKWYRESLGRRFTKSEIQNIISNSTTIGKGGFGEVHRGNLNNTEVAVKVLSSSSSQGSDEFQNEVKLLMRVHHRNLVSLIGYCDERDTMALVYEYVANGNLQQHLSADVSDKNFITWKDRLQIALDGARGLEYLHNGCKPSIIHRDIKTTNILVDEKLHAKIGDFGICKVLATDSSTHTSTTPRGTRGYYDPEYSNTGKLNKKSDVYSFGIVLLELITGRPAIIRDVDGDVIHICQWVSPKFERKQIEIIVDSKLKGTYSTSCAGKAIEIAMACVPPTAIQRPEISSVYLELKECLEIDFPPEKEMIRESNDGSSNSSNHISIQMHSSYTA